MAAGTEERGVTNPSEFEQGLSDYYSDLQDQDDAVPQGDQAEASAEELERMYQLGSDQQVTRRGQAVSTAAEMAKQRGRELAVQAAKTAGKQVGKAAGLAAKRGMAWLGGFLASTFPVWGPIAGIILVITLVLVAVVGLVYSNCQSNNIAVSGTTQTISKINSWFGGVDVCKMFSGLGGNTSITNTTTVETRQQGGVSTTGDASARAYLALYGITVNNPQPRTSLEDMLQSTLEEVVNLKLACDQWAEQTGRGDCTVVVTGGTETGYGHTERGTCIHSNGYKIDLRLSPNLDGYIQSHFTRSGSRGNDPRYINGRAVYVLEGDHWDITVGC